MNDPSRFSPSDRFVDSRRIVVVGPCASGKSTLVAALRARGYDARVSGQEHSAVAALWRTAQPDVLIALDADIAAVRARRAESWPEWLHDLQLTRLRQAIEAADVRIDTSSLAADRVTDLVLDFLEHHPAPTAAP
jgi:dienelactone hydrolase